MMNLEKQSKCVNPGQLFPIWLTDARLRGEGSTIVKVQFHAIIDSVDEKVQLRSVVGRALWKEVWGSFVEGEKWWWEDEGIVTECLELKTKWEWAVIEGVKED